MLRFNRNQCSRDSGENHIAELEGVMTTAEREPHPFVTKVIDLFGNWLKQRRELNELVEYAADPGELEPDALQMLVRQGS